MQRKWVEEKWLSELSSEICKLHIDENELFTWDRLSIFNFAPSPYDSMTSP